MQHMNKAILIGGILAIAVVVAGMTTTTKLALASTPSPAGDHLVCFDGDARYDIQAKGYQDGVNDFNHVKHYLVVPLSTLNATEISLYHQGYHDGWMDAKVNGTAMDKSCYEDNIS
jgi:hypothetical protein